MKIILNVATLAGWPQADAAKLQQDTAPIVVQVNGKLRARITVPQGAAQDVGVQQAQEDARVVAHMGHGNIVKVIFVQDKLLNFVVR